MTVTSRLDTAALAPGSGPIGADAIFSSLVDYFAAIGIELYPAQEEAIFALLAGRHVVLSTPTGSGKSLVATALLWKALCEGKTGVYTCPVKALVNEKFFDLCGVFGPERVGLATGDASVNPGAPIICATAEILANQVVRRTGRPPDYVVMDEFHYYADEERGIAWQLPLLGLPDTCFLLMSATLGDMTAIMDRLRARTARDVVPVGGMKRPVPLQFSYSESTLHEAVFDLVRDNRAPIYLVNFTQRACAEQAQSLTSIDLCGKDAKAALKQALHGERFVSPYGKEIHKLLTVGIGLHHAGLLPRYRRLVERLAQRGLLKIISGTDTLGVGVNIPIRTVLFTQLCKYDGRKDTILPVRDFHQISGRAGRKGFDDVGYVVALAPAHVVENKKLAAKSKKFVRKQPPKKGYVHYDHTTFDRLIAGTPEPLSSRFAISHGLLLSALQAGGSDPGKGGGYRRVLDLIAACHDADAQKRRHKRTAAGYFRTLRKLGLVAIRRDEKARNPYPEASPDLQRVFSLDQTLALYLIETLPLLDPSLPSYPLDLLSLVEAILENPRAILFAQQDREKGLVVAALKAEGVEYEQRMEELEKVEWPKPNRDFIYATFNEFALRHPWVGADNIAPKGVARELFEHRATFNEFVRDLGVARSEGVLLRYLSDVCRTLTRGVPAKHQTPEVADMALTIETAVRLVDASLLAEWEALRDGGAGAGATAGGAITGAGAAVPVVSATEAAPPSPHASLRRLTTDPRALHARVRGELHRLLGAIARKDWDEALESILPEDEAGAAWTRERLAAELAPVFAAHTGIDVTPAARAPSNTLLKAVGDKRWEATQRMIGVGGRASDLLAKLGGTKVDAPTGSPNDESAEDAAGDFADTLAEDPVILALVDLTEAARADLPDEAPVLTLRRIPET